MASKKRRPGRTGDPVSRAPLTPAQAMAALLNDKSADVKNLEAKKAGARKTKGTKSERANPIRNA
jgi:hypothetical protein